MFVSCNSLEITNAHEKVNPELLVNWNQIIIYYLSASKLVLHIINYLKFLDSILHTSFNY